VEGRRRYPISKISEKEEIRKYNNYESERIGRIAPSWE